MGLMEQASKNPRLNKYLVSAGLAQSRRSADKIISSGRVTLNGAVVSDLSSRVNSTDKVELDGQSGRLRADIYLAYNKPKGLVCSHSRNDGGRTIFDELPPAFSSLKIAGRLDKDSEGLMILSSDGAFINNVTHPSSNKSKAYLVDTKQDISDAMIEQFNKGVRLLDGVSKLKATKIGRNRAKIIISEGRNRQIRRSFETLGLTIIKLQRVRIGLYSNKSLGPKEFVFIKPEDVV